MMPFVFKWEGTKFENDPDDPGGATKYGIDQRSHPREDIRNLTEKRATQIYKEEYWDRNKCGSYRSPLGEAVFDTAINCGSGRVKKIFDSGARSASEFLDERDDFYRRLSQSRSKSKKYLKGWLNRTQDLRKFLGITDQYR